jgi:hypothetical protein
MSGGIKLVRDDDTSSQPPYVMSGACITASRQIQAMANAAHVWAELIQDVSSGALELELCGTQLRYKEEVTAGGAAFEVKSADAVRALGETLVAPADRADALGYFREMQTAATAGDE